VKRIAKLLFIFLLGFMIIPMVHAEDLPEEGVMYFMEYPNNTEEVTANYEEASNPEEVLIFSGMTDKDGKINLCDWTNSGQLRIVQEVPDGYTTSTKEIKVDLSRDNNASFINYRGLSNPQTGRSILVFLGIIGVVTVTILVSRKNKKSLLVIPVVLGIFAVTQVKADTCFCIQVKDGNGKALSNVHIDVYAKPNNIEAYPAIIYDANGGKFFDGKEKMYIRIPSSTCTSESFYNSLSKDEASYIQENLALIHRDGYSFVDYTSTASDPYTVVNGMVISAEWEKEEETNPYIEIDANGGIIDFHGRKLNTVTIPETSKNKVINNISPFLSNKSLKFIGLDKTESCSRFNEHGIEQTSLDTTNSVRKYYACWADKADGIYVNDELFIGNPDSCFNHQNMEVDFNSTGMKDSIYFYNSNSVIYVGDYTLDDVYFTKMKTYERTSFENNFQSRPARYNAEYEEKEINKIELVKDGNTLVTITSEDITLEDGVYYIDNDEKRPILLDYFAIFDDKGCWIM